MGINMCGIALCPWTSMAGFGNLGKNRFLPGRMEETGKQVFLPVSSGRKWEKMEEIHVINSACKQMVRKKSPDTVN